MNGSLSSSIGRKLIVALTGLGLIGFVLAHLAGNLQVFRGQDALDGYAEGLRHLGPLLWALRLGLLALAVAHVALSLQLAAANRAARGSRYAVTRPVQATPAARSMLVTGLMLLLFVVYHLAHFTWGLAHPEFSGRLDAAGRPDVYSMLVGSFGRPWIAAPYVVAMVLLGLHLSHGVSSVFQTLGWRGPRTEKLVARLGPLLGAVVAAGYISIPLAVQMGVIVLPSGVTFPVKLDARIPGGPIQDKWDRHRFEMKLVNPANKRRFRVLVVGTGLAGGSAAASLAELGYYVDAFCFQDSARRAHSIAAQGGINAAKNYQNDGDSVWRLFYDTVKGGDFRAREANVYRLAQVSAAIIDQCVAQGVPFAREYGGQLANRSFGGAQVSRTFYARGQTGQQLLLGCYAALSRQVGLGKVRMHARTELLDIVVIGGRARGIVTRDLVNGKIQSWAGDAVVLATGGYSNVFFLSTNAKGCNVTATWRAHKRGAGFANPCFTQIHPTCIPQAGEHQSKLTLMSESLRNDGRVWVPKAAGDKRPPPQIPDADRDYYLERKYPSFGNLAPRDIASRSAKEACDGGRGVGPGGRGVFLDFRDSIKRLGRDAIADRYGNLFDMYARITGENPYESPMRIYPAPHYTMGGLWVDYNLMSTIPGLHVIGEANFSDHGANRLGASALMQGLADGYFILPYTIGHWFASEKLEPVSTEHAEFRRVETEVRERTQRLLAAGGTRSPDSFHRELGALMWDKAGMARNAAGLADCLRRIPELREQFWKDVRVLGNGDDLNTSLEKAGRVADFLEFAELLCRDALAREESCGGHFREEHQTPDGEAKRDDAAFCHASVWEWTGTPAAPAQHAEPLVFENVRLATRSYK